MTREKKTVQPEQERRASARTASGVAGWALAPVSSSAVGAALAASCSSSLLLASSEVLAPHPPELQVWQPSLVLLLSRRPFPQLEGRRVQNSTLRRCASWCCVPEKRSNPATS